MPARVIDLDQLVPADREIKLGGKTWKVPASPPMPYMMWMNGFIERFTAENLEEGDITACYEHTVALLMMRSQSIPEFEVALGKVKAGRCPKVEATVGQCVSFYNYVYLQDVEADESPKGRTRGGGTSSSKTPRSKSRSST